MSDYGKELNEKIAARRRSVQALMVRLDAEERELADLQQERSEAREECKFCNDCSMCLP